MTIRLDNSSASVGRAAQYVRMSTDMQKYSIDNQQAIIALYAATHGFDVVRTYADEGRSGLKIKGRLGLQQLLSDVRSGSADFDTVLVYDISRWGRFQDVDESAYYEFVCREAGIQIRYCAEDFDNDGSLSATIFKTIKRAMAAEYSRELSTKVFAGKSRMIQRGFRTGGRAGFGLRRMVVDQNGLRKGILEDGEQKFVHTDRTILVPGPQSEVETVRWIFQCFVDRKASLAGIATELNAQNILNGIGKPWVSQAVRSLLENEKYIGNNVFNRTSAKLSSKCVRNPPERWIRVERSFEPIVDQEIFAKAQHRLASIVRSYTDHQLLDHLTGLWCRYGKLSSEVMTAAPTCPSTHTFIEHFGGILSAFKQVGYRKLSRRPVYVSKRRIVSDVLVTAIRTLGGTARYIGLRRQTRLLINEEVVLTVSLAHWAYQTHAGRPRWIIKHGARHHSDLVVVVRYEDELANKISDYFLLPGIVLDNPQHMIFDQNHIELEIFRSNSLAPIYPLFARQNVETGIKYRRSIYETTKKQSRRSISSPKIKFNKAALNVMATVFVRAYKQCSSRMLAFIEKSGSFQRRQQEMEQALQSLLTDRTFCKILFDEGLDVTPSIIAERLSRKGVSCRTA